MQAVGTVMGRPKKQRDGEPEIKFETIAVRATPEWKSWAERGAEYCRLNVSTAIDVALAEYFRVRGFEEPPPKRY